MTRTGKGKIHHSIWRYACSPKVGLKKYLDGPDASQLVSQVKSFIALAFVPLDQLDAAYNELVSADNLNPKLKPMHAYFKVQNKVI